MRNMARRRCGKDCTEISGHKARVTLALQRHRCARYQRRKNAHGAVSRGAKRRTTTYNTHGTYVTYQNGLVLACVNQSKHFGCAGMNDRLLPFERCGLVSRRPRNDQWLPQLAGGGETGAGEGGSNEDAEPALDLAPHDGGRANYYLDAAGWAGLGSVERSLSIQRTRSLLAPRSSTPSQCLACCT
jgi:hypothetical protein